MVFILLSYLGLPAYAATNYTLPNGNARRKT